MPPPTIVRVQSFPGPNIYAPGPCVALWVDVGSGAPGVRPEFLEALLGHPGLAGSAPAPAATAGAAAAGFDDAVAWLAVVLQQALGHPPAAATPQPAGGPAVIPVWDEEAGLLAARAAFALVALALDGAEPDQAAQVILDRYFALARAINYSESSIRVLQAAARRGISWGRLVPRNAMLRLGQGARQRSLLGSYTPNTSHVATHLATQKDLAAARLRRQGLPVPANRRVRSVEDALRAAAWIGFPVVVKPAATDFGIAVSLDVRDEAALARAYAAAARHGPVLVEQQIAGDHTRLLVIQGRFVSAVRQDPAQVTGDGLRTVRALIEAVNRDRTAALSSSFKKIAIDEESALLLARQGLALDGVPPAGCKVVLRHTSNTSRGGTARNVTGLVHPDNARLAERAAEVVGLDMAGVDLITPDIGRSFREVGGAICEINPGPGLYMREPDARVEDALLDGLFGPGGRGRIPILCLLAEDGEAAAAGIAAIAGRLRPRIPGLAMVWPGGACIGDWPVGGRERRPHAAARLVLADPATAALVICLTDRDIVEGGLPFDACDAVLAWPAAVGGHAPARALLAGHTRRWLDATAPDSIPDAVAAMLERMDLPDGL